MYRIDMYYDAGGVLVPLHKPMALITDGLRSASVCHAESNYIATPIDPEFAPPIRAKRSRASLGKPKTQMLDYCLALELLTLLARFFCVKIEFQQDLTVDNFDYVFDVRAANQPPAAMAAKDEQTLG